MAVQTQDTSSQIQPVPPAEIVSYTFTFWLRLPPYPSLPDPAAYVMALRGEPIVGLVCDHTLSLLQQPGGGIAARWQDPCGAIVDTLVPFDESPAVDEWVFVAVSMNALLTTLRWCEPCDTAFSALRTVDLATQSFQGQIARLGTDATGQTGVTGGGFAMARQWTRVLSDPELIAEKNSAVAVIATNLWASNPLSTASDDSDQSGNGNTVSLNLLETIDDPELCVLLAPVCDEIGRGTRAYVSAYQRARVHQSRLYRFERRCFVANFNGAFPPARTIVSATWRTDAPEVGIMSSPQISANGRETMVMFATQLGGWANMRVDATLDNGERYNQMFKINVREASGFFDDPPTQSGPFSVTVSVP